MRALVLPEPGAPRALAPGGGHLIDPAGPEVLAFVEEVLAGRIVEDATFC